MKLKEIFSKQDFEKYQSKKHHTMITNEKKQIANKIIIKTTIRLFNLTVILNQNQRSTNNVQTHQ